MRHVLANERGTVVLLFLGLFLPLFLLASAVALDFGAAHIHRQRLQTAADAAALAGAREHDIFADITAYGRQWVTHTTCAKQDQQGKCLRWETWGHYHTHSWSAPRVLARNAEAEARMLVPTGWEYTGYAAANLRAELRSRVQVEEAASEAWRVNAALAVGASAPSINIVGKDTVDVSGSAEQRTGFLGLFGVTRLGERIWSTATAEPR